MVQWRFDQADFTALRLVGYPFSLRLVSVSGPCSPIMSQVFFTQYLFKGTTNSTASY